MRQRLHRFTGPLSFDGWALPFIHFEPDPPVRLRLSAMSNSVVAPNRRADTPLCDAYTLGACRAQCRRTGCRNGHRPLRIHPDPAADDHAGCAYAAGSRRAGHRELRRVPRRCACGYRLTAAGPIDGRVAGSPGGVGGHLGCDAPVAQHNWMAAVAHSCGIRQRGCVCHCGQLDAGTSATTPARLGLRRCRPRHCVIGWVGADDARRSGLAGRMVDRRSGGSPAWRRCVDDARESPSRFGSPASLTVIIATCQRLVRCAVRQLHPRGNRVHHRWHIPGRGHQTEFGRRAGQRCVARRRLGRAPVGRTVGVAVCAVVASDSARRSAAAAGVRNRPSSRSSRGGRGCHRGNPVRGHLHRCQHNDSGSRTPARISRRRGRAD
jgi:hypothetical protein